MYRIVTTVSGYVSYRGKIYCCRPSDNCIGIRIVSWKNVSLQSYNLYAIILTFYTHLFTQWFKHVCIFTLQGMDFFIKLAFQFATFNLRRKQFQWHKLLLTTVSMEYSEFLLFKGTFK